MYSRLAITKSLSLLTHHNCYYSGHFKQKLVYLIQRVLNKMARQEKQTIQEKVISQQGMVPGKQGQAKTLQQAQKRFITAEKTLSRHEKGRLQRIDEILGTNTYFHETQTDQQKIDSQHVIKISQLQPKNIEKSRDEIDSLNPQIPKKQQTRKKKKFMKLLKHLKTYPQGNIDLANFNDESNPTEQKEQAIHNDSLMKFLSQQALFLRFSIPDLQQTTQSINQQQLLVQDEGILLDLETQFGKFVFKGQTYFKPRHLMSIFRIDNNNYSKKLASQIKYFTQMIINKQGHIQEVVTLDQIYQCLKNYYFDQRVSQYIGKIQNNQLEYFLTSLQVSPNGNDIFIVIDLLGTKKQFVGLYKHIGQQFSETPEIYHQNVIFNFHPQVALRDNGQLYCVQRNDQGLFIQLTKIKFQPYYPKPPKTTNQQQNKSIELLKIKKNQQVLYKCLPFCQLQIINKNQAQISTENYNIVSNNILLQQIDVGVSTNNQLYLILHNNNKVIPFNMQLITSNNKQLKKLFDQENVKEKFPFVQHWETNPLNFYTECHEIKEIGYLVLRYQFTGALKGSYLKYGHSQKFAKKQKQPPPTQITLNNSQKPKPKLQSFLHQTQTLPINSIKYLLILLISQSNCPHNKICH